MKKRILTVLIAIITVIPFVLVSPKADVQTSTHTITSYGDYTFQQGMSTTTFNYELPGLPINLTWNSGSYMKLDYNFKDKYSGSMKLTVTSNQDWVLNSSPVYWSVSGDGVESVCYISNTTTMSATGKTKTFSIIFYNCTGIHFNVATGSSANFFTSSNSITITNATFTSQPDLGDIDYTLDHISSQFDFYIPGMSTSLSNIDTDLDNINTNIQALSPYIDELEGYVDGLETYLEQLQVISLYNIEPYQHAAWVWCSRKDSEFPRWQYGLPYASYYTNNNDGSYTAANGIRLSQGYSYIMVFYSSSAITVNDISLYYSATTGQVSVTSLPINEIVSQLYLQAFIFTNTNTGFTSFEPEISKSFNIYPLYFGLTTNVPDEIRALLGQEYDNTYTRLLQSINNGIGLLNGDYDTSEYEQYEQTIDDLNDDMRDIFEIRQQQFERNLDDLFNNSAPAGATPVNMFTRFHFDSINNVFTGFLTDILNVAPSLKYILLFCLLLLVLGVLI